MSLPLISVVMPSYNQAEFIAFAIESVFSQRYGAVELIVADGGSEDGTVELLDTYSMQHSNLFWDSTPDDGPADAVMRAISKARGQIIGWLNSDDMYLEGAFDSVSAAFADNPDWIMCYGHGEHVDEAGRRIERYPTLRPERGVAAFSGGCFICQPTVFLKAPAITMLGGLNKSLKTAFDYDYWIRAFKAFPERIGFVDQVLAQSRLHADCITRRMRETVALEGLALGKLHFGEANLHWAVTCLEELRGDIGADRAMFGVSANKFLDAAREYIGDKEVQILRTTLGI